MPAPLEFSIRFSEPGPLARSDNAFRLSGPGRLTITGDELVLNGARRAPFGLRRRQQELRFALADVRNASAILEEAMVAFEVQAPGGRAQRVVVWAADAEAAERLLNALPARQTEDHRARVADSHEYLTRLQQLPPAVGVARALVAINVVVFGAMALAGAGLMDPDPQVHIRWGSNHAPLTSTGEWWRLVTSMFLHFGAIHLILNCWCLYSLGPLTERLYGSLRFSLIYLFAGVSGSCASMLWNPAGNSAGASGAIFGVLGALIAFVINRANGIPPSVVMSQRNSLLTFLAYNLVFGFIHPAIDNAAHIGGLVAGFLLGLLLARPLAVEARQDRGVARVLLVAAGWLLAAGGVYERVSGDTALQEDQQFRLGMSWIESREPAMVRRYAKLVEGLLERKIEAATFVREMESDVLPFWREAERRVAPESVHPDSSLRALRLAVRDYVRSRARSAQLLTQGARTGNVDELNAGRRELARASRLIEAVNAAR